LSSEGEGITALPNVSLNGTVWIAQTGPVEDGSVVSPPPAPSEGPSLSISLEGDELVLTWIASEEGPFVVESTKDLGTPFAEATITSESTADGTTTVRLPKPGTGIEFLRLRSQ